MSALTGKVCLITGGSSGIGFAIASGLAAKEAEVILCGRRMDRLEQAAQRIIATGGKATSVTCDVSSEADVERLFAGIVQGFGRLDVLMNNAGIVALGPLEKLPVDDWDRVLATNLRGPFLCSQQAFRIMKKQGSGRIINIGSLSAHRVRPGNGAYNASKFGLEGLTHTLALEGRPFGISCGSLHPGNTASEITAGSDFKEPKIRAEDVARVAVLMASMPDDSNVFQAIVLPVDQLFVGRG